MTPNRTLAISVFAAALFCAGTFRNASAAQTLQGGWAISPSNQAGEVELMLFRRTEHSNMNSSNSWKLDQLTGLTAAQLKAASSPVRFAIAREAGRIECTGNLQAGSGGGAFTFTQNPEFLKNMRSLGYDGLSDDTVFAMALHDVSTAFVKELKAEGVQIPNKDMLLALRIHNVTGQYVREMKTLGASNLSADNLVAMRIHGVTAEFAKSLKDMGYDPKPDSLVALRIHGVTPSSHAT